MQSRLITAAAYACIFLRALTSRDKNGTSILRQLYVFVSGGQVNLDLRSRSIAVLC